MVSPKEPKKKQAKMRHLLKEGEISKLLPKGGGGGASKEVYLIKHKGKKYVVRKCKTKDRADTFEKITKKFEKYDFLPKYLGRYRNNLFFEYIKGRDLTDKDVKYAEKVGKIYGYINQGKSDNKERYDFTSKFYKNLNFLLERKIINKKDYNLIIKKFKELKRKVKLKFGFDNGDMDPHNFRFYNGKVYYVDIEGINETELLEVVSEKFF